MKIFYAYFVVFLVSLPLLADIFAISSKGEFSVIYAKEDSVYYVPCHRDTPLLDRNCLRAYAGPDFHTARSRYEQRIGSYAGLPPEFQMQKSQMALSRLIDLRSQIKLEKSHTVEQTIQLDEAIRVARTHQAKLYEISQTFLQFLEPNRSFTVDAKIDPMIYQVLFWALMPDVTFSFEEALYQVRFEESGVNAKSAAADCPAPWRLIHHSEASQWAQILLQSDLRPHLNDNVAVGDFGIARGLIWVNTALEYAKRDSLTKVALLGEPTRPPGGQVVGGAVWSWSEYKAANAYAASFDTSLSNVKKGPETPGTVLCVRLVGDPVPYWAQ